MRLTIIGGGPGGYTAAFEAARRGCEVTLVERESLGGTCLNRGCIPTKTLRASADALALAGRLAEYGVSCGAGCSAPALDLDAARGRKDKVIEILRGGLEKSCAKFKVKLLRGSGRVKDAKTVLVQGADGETAVSGDAVLIATGSKVLELPGLAFDGEHILSSDDALKLTRIPKRLVIVGGGVIGCEMACIYREFGSEVIVVEGQDRLLPLPSVDQDLSALLNREMRKRKIKILTGKTLKDVRVEGDTVRASAAPSPFVQSQAASGGQAAEEALEADMVLVTVGRVPATDGLGLEEAGITRDQRGWITVDERLETSLPGVYAVGDVLGPARIMLAHVAAAEGLRVVENLCGAPADMNRDVVPSAIFTAPEIGCVGLSEAQARERGLAVVCGTVQTRELGKAQAMGELPGFFKIVAEAESGRLLGVHIAGAHASDLVAEAALALNMGATVDDIAETIHAHPTLAEGLWEAALETRRAMNK